MRQFIFLVASVSLAVGLHADPGPAGTCGGINFTDNPDLPFRVYVLSGQSDIGIFGEIMTAAADSCLFLETAQFHQSNISPGLPWDCSVAVFRFQPDCQAKKLDAALDPRARQIVDQLLADGASK